MRYVLIMSSLILLVVPAYAAKIKTTEDLVQAMQKKYGKSWYKTATFVQKTTNYEKDGTKKIETWYEALSVPGSLRIDFTPVKDGNGILFTDNKIYILTRADALEKLKGLKFDLSILREDIWQGRSAYVVGARQGDLHSPQFWIEKKNLYFLRMIRPAGKDGTQ